MKNKISYLGLLGLLGIVGLITGELGFYGFFGFFGFFAYSNIIPDEMFKVNVDKAGKNAFFAGIILYPVVIIISLFKSVLITYALGFASSFAIQILVFSISLAKYEKTGDN